MEHDDGASSGPEDERAQQPVVDAYEVLGRVGHERALAIYASAARRAGSIIMNEPVATTL